MRFLVAVFVLLTQFASAHCAKADARSVKGMYRNPAQGYVIRIPKGVKAIAGEQAGPERGVSIHLESGNSILTIGEPNSAEYKNPQEGIRASLKFEDCHPREATITVATMGKITGSKGRLACGNRIYVTMLAFRPRGGPIYWLRLETDPAHEREDEAVLQSVAASFRIIRWQ